MLGKHIDLSDGEPPRAARRPGRPFIGVHFACCRTYGRIYLQSDRVAYYGHCPRCGKRLRIVNDSGGSDSRFFSAY